MRFFLVMLCVWPGTLLAECLRDSGRIETVCGAGPCVQDRYGEVYCAPHIDGSALRDRRGIAVCSAGQCARDTEDRIVCSAQPGGAVLQNRFGEVDCYGGCVEAQASLCEREFTGPRDDNGELILQPGPPPTGYKGYRPPGRVSR